MRDGEHMRKKRSEEVVRFVIDRSKRRMRREREREIRNYRMRMVVSYR